MVKQKVNQTTRIKLLSKQALFTHLSAQELHDLALLAHEITFREGEEIVSEGEFVDDFFIIVKGEAEVLKKQEIGGATKNLILAVLTKNDNIGLSDKGFYSPHGRRSATVKALASSLLLCFSTKDFQNFLAIHPVFNKQLQKSIKLFNNLHFLKELPIFSQLKNNVIYQLSEQIIELRLPANTIIFNKNDYGDGCYIIVEGEVEIFSPRPDGSERRHALLQKKDLFGEASLLTSNQFRNASARTTEASEFIFIERKIFFNIIKDNTDFARSTIGLMTQNLRPKKANKIIEHQATSKEGKLIVMLENPITNRYYRLTEQSLYIWRQIDGLQTVQNIIISFIKKFHIIVPDLICNLLYTLQESGFVEIPVIELPFEEDLSNTFKDRVKKVLQKVSTSEYTFTQTDRWLTSLYKSGIDLFYTKPIQILFFIVIILGIFSFVDAYPHVTHISHNTSLNFGMFILSLPILGTIVVIIHELAHAFTAKKMGYKVQRMGIGWYWFGPVAFVDTSELWLANKFSRLMVNVAGIYIELLIASSLAIFSVVTSNPTFSIFCWLYALFLYYGAFKNASPIREYDGYAIISDVLGQERLRRQTMRYLANIFYYRTKIDPKDYKIERVYCYTCIIYLVLSGLFIFFIIHSVLKVFLVKSILTIPIFQFSIIIAFLLFSLSIYSLYREIKRFITQVD